MLIEHRRGGGPALIAGPFPRTAAALVAGAGAGFLGQVADGASPWTANLASYGGPWLAAVVVVGWWSPDRPAAAQRAAAFLVGVVAGYYVTFRLGQGGGPAAFVLLWSAAAVTLGPLAGVAARTARTAGATGAVATGLLAGLLAAEAAFVTGWRVDPTRWSLVAFDLAAAAVLVSLSRMRLLTAAVLAAGSALGVALLLGFQTAVRTLLP